MKKELIVSGQTPPQVESVTAATTLAESAIFDKLNRDFGDSITSVLRAMQERDVPEGKVTVTVDITAAVGNGNIVPKFMYKVGRALICKSETKGEIEPDGHLAWDEEKQCYRYTKAVSPQTDLFDDDDEPEAEETTAIVAKEDASE